jgi:LmbE family N-acetylglucosaminyl deacetylase
MGAGRIIGIRHHYFLGQDDTGFTLDPGEGFRSWDLPLLRRKLQNLLQSEQYDLVLTLLPAHDTHGHHQTVAVLALEAAAAMPLESRPAVAGVRAASPANNTVPVFNELTGFPATRTTSGAPVWSFDRRTPLRKNAALDHSIIVHWVIAEHKSQGMFQMEYGRHTHEYFWQFATGRERWDSLWQKFAEMGPVTRQLAPAEAA